MPSNRNLIFIGILGVLTLAAFSNSFHGELIFDSRAIVLKDERVHTLTLENLKTIFSTDYWYPADGGLFRPVTTSSYLLNYALLGNGPNPAGYHWINFLLHWLNAALVFLIARALFDAPLPAFFAAALFALHPVTTEAVTNVAGRADLLAACSVLGGFLLYLEIKKDHGAARRRYVAALALASVAGVFAKENAVVLIAVMALYDLAFRKTPPVKAAYGVAAASLAIMFTARWLVFRHAGAVPDSFLDNPLRGASFWTGRLTAIAVLARDFWILIWPQHLSPSYSYNQIPMFRWTDWGAVAEVASVCAFVAIALAMYRWSRTIFFLLGWMIVALLPTANLFVQIDSIMAERFLYLPLAGFAVCIVFVFYRCLPKRAAPLLLAPIVIVLGIRTHARNADWQDGLHLWTAAEQVTPASYTTHMMLGVAWADKPPAGSEIDRAIAEGEKAAAIVDTLPFEKRLSVVYVPLGVAYRVKGSRASSTAEQRFWYQKSVEVFNACIPMDHVFLEHLHRANLRKGHNDTLRSTADYVIYENLGKSLLLLGENQKALDAFLMMQRAAPFNPDAGVRLGEAYQAMAQPQQAAIAYQESLILQPNHPDANRGLVALYSKIDTAGCAVDIDKRVNQFCPAVHRDLCVAYSQLEETFRNLRNFKFAERLKNRAVTDDGCSASSR